MTRTWLLNAETRLEPGLCVDAYLFNDSRLEITPGQLYLPVDE
jgi:hypothetical protein